MKIKNKMWMASQSVGLLQGTKAIACNVRNVEDAGSQHCAMERCECLPCWESFLNNWARVSLRTAEALLGLPGRTGKHAYSSSCGVNTPAGNQFLPQRGAETSHDTSHLSGRALHTWAPQIWNPERCHSNTTPGKLTLYYFNHGRLTCTVCAHTQEF